VRVDYGRLGEFEVRVCEALRRVGPGETTTYGALAAAVGDPGAAQAVGRAMSRNPVPIVVPCHRVLAAGGRIGGFSAYGGTITKARLLDLEGAVAGGPADQIALAL
jgi:methylated-DNA-[protein]-cysteine S-methyltransferase